MKVWAVPRLEQLLDKFHSFSADFEQVLTDVRGREFQRFSGNMDIKKPNLFRWEIKKPESVLIISDGKKLWHYDVILEQVTVQALNLAVDDSLAAFFLASDLSSIMKKFTVTELKNPEKNPDAPENAECFELRPNYSSANFQQVKLVFVKDKLWGMSILDPLEQWSEIKFKNFTTNKRFRADRFQFVPPASVDVIGE